MADVVTPDLLYPWEPGVTVGIVGGIPTYSGSISVSDYGAVGDGVADDTAAFLAAQTAAADSSIIVIPPGTYRCDSRIHFNKVNIVWRGLGMGVSKLVFYSNDYSYLGYSDWPPATPTMTVTAGATAGSTVLTCDTTAYTSVGQIVTLSSLNISTVKYNSTYYGSGPGEDGHDSDRLAALTVRVVGKTSNTVTISQPLPCDFTDTPMLTGWTNLIVGVGFEDLTIDMANTPASAGLYFNNAYGCWLKNVEIASPASRYVWMNQSVNCQITGCYFHDTRGGGPNHEGIDLYQNCCFNLIEDNRLIRAGYPMVILGDFGGGCSCNVIAYNYCEDVESGSSVAGFAISDNHGPHNMFNLIEGNWAQNFCSDGYYGSSSHGSLHRNRFTGVFDKVDYLWPYALHLGHWATSYNIVGNILGEPGYTADLRAVGSSYSGATAVIYSFGYPNAGNSTYTGSSSNPTDPDYLDTNVEASAIIKGNYNYTDNAIPAGEAWGADTAPISRFRSSKPAYFGDRNWPPIDSSSPLGLTYDCIPAGYRQLNGGGPDPDPDPTRVRFALAPQYSGLI